jgi:hypothetical protein
MYDVIYEAEIALCNINKLPLQLNSGLSLPLLLQLKKASCCLIYLQHDKNAHK